MVHVKNFYLSYIFPSLFVCMESSLVCMEYVNYFLTANRNIGFFWNKLEYRATRIQIMKRSAIS
uniref:Secreted protein n=1 Tax=Heterorhabditis bacteriophora TaxID=37862 RepID=A0A1I7WL48_HETBA